MRSKFARLASKAFLIGYSLLVHICIRVPSNSLVQEVNFRAHPSSVCSDYLFMSKLVRLPLAGDISKLKISGSGPNLSRLMVVWLTHCSISPLELKDAGCCWYFSATRGGCNSITALAVTIAAFAVRFSCWEYSVILWFWETFEILSCLTRNKKSVAFVIRLSILGTRRRIFWSPGSMT